MFIHLDRHGERTRRHLATGFVLGCALLFGSCGSDRSDTTVNDNTAETDVIADTEETVSGTAAAVAVTTPPTDEVAPVVPGAPTGRQLASEGQRTTWTGTIGDDIAISMWLAQTGQLVRGEITYNTVGEPIMILGRAYAEGDGYFLQELLPDGRVTGYMTLGTVADGVVSESTWGDQPLVLDFAGIDDLPYFFDPLVRPGAYAFSHAPFGDDDECCGPAGSLILSDLDNDSLVVAFDNHNGGPGFNLATVDSTTIPLSDNRALYESHDDGYDCAFEVIIFDGFAFVEYVDNRFDCGFGNAASVVGNYVLTAQTIPAAESVFANAVLDDDSFGPVSLGDSWASLIERFGVRPFDDELDGIASEGCSYLTIEGDPLSPWFMMLGEREAAVVSRIELTDPNQRTEAGVGIGSTEADVLVAYPDAIDPSAHEYTGADAKYLTVITNDKSESASTILFETDGSGAVAAARNGYVGPISWIEGCS